MRLRIAATSIALAALSRLALSDPASEPAALFHQGQAAYDQQRYDDALAAWEQSYALSHVPALLYNIAQARRLRGHAGDCTSARASYAKFIELSPPSPERDLASRYVTELATCANTPVEPRPSLANQVPSTTSGVSTSSQPPNKSVLNGRSIGGAVLGVASIGLLTGGIALGHHASLLGDDVTHACAVSCNWPTESTRDAAGRRDAAVGWALDGIGAAALAGAAVLFYFGFNERDVAITPVGASIGAAMVWNRTW